MRQLLIVMTFVQMVSSTIEFSWQPLGLLYEKGGKWN